MKKAAAKKKEPSKAKNVAISTILTVMILGGGFFATEYFLAGVDSGHPALAYDTVLAEGETAANFWLQMHNAWFTTGRNVTMIRNISTTNLTLVPWYCSSDSCNQSALKGTNSVASCSWGSGTDANTCNLGGTMDPQNRFCMVSDEHSQFCMATAFRNDSTKTDYIDGCFNVIAMNNASDEGYGSMTHWKFGWDNNLAGPAKLVTSVVSDCASDAEARYIIMARITKMNTNYPQALRDKAAAYMDQACPDFIEYTFWNKTGQGEKVNGRPIDWYSTGGCNVGSHGSFDWSNAFYTGYFGDNTLAALSCYAHTNNTLYLDVARNTTSLYLAAANWTNTSGFKVPDGKEFDLTGGSAGARTPVCNVDCGIWSDADPVRATSICTAGHFAENLMGVVNFSTDLAMYCNQWAHSYNTSGTACITATTYNRMVKPQGTCNVGDISNSYPNNGLASYIDIWANQSRLETRFETIDTKFSQAAQTFDGGACMGIYFPTLSIVPLGYAIGWADAAFTPITQENITYDGSAASMNNGNLSISLVSPLNGSVGNNGTTTNLSVQVWNVNTFNSSSCTSNTTSGVFFSKNFNETPGASVTGGTWDSVNFTYYTTTSYAVFLINIEELPLYADMVLNFTAYFPTNQTNFKVFPWETVSSSANNHIYASQNGANLKFGNEPGYNLSVDKSYGLHNLSLNLNRTGNKVILIIDGSTAFTWTAPVPDMDNTNSTYIRIEVGSFPSNNRTYIKNVTVSGSRTVDSCTYSYHNASMNVSFYWDNGTLIYNNPDVANGTQLNYSLTLNTTGKYNWTVLVRSANSVLNFTPLTFNYTSTYVAPPPSFNISNANYTRCVNISDIKFRSNVTAGSYNVTSNTYTESNMMSVNTSICGYTYKFNNTAGAAVNYIFQTNLSNNYIRLKIAGVAFNSTSNGSVSIGNNSIGYANLTADYVGIPLTVKQIPFSINITAVAQ